MCSVLWLTILSATVSAQDQGRIRANQEGFQQLQTRLLTLNANGVLLTNYHLAKAQAWLDFSKEEYFDNDRSGIVESTFGEALRLTEQLEAGVTTPLDLSTPLLEGPVRLETDAWQKVEDLRKEKWDCAGHLIARLEVQLVHVEHELHELGPIHAAPYRQAVQRIIEEIKDVDCRPVTKAPAAPLQGSASPSKPE
jgi:hypothetical protein